MYVTKLIKQITIENYEIKMSIMQDKQNPIQMKQNKNSKQTTILQQKKKKKMNRKPTNHSNSETNEPERKTKAETIKKCKLQTPPARKTNILIENAKTSGGTKMGRLDHLRLFQNEK